MHTETLGYTIVLNSKVQNITKDVKVATFDQLITSLRNHIQYGWTVGKIARLVGIAEALTPDEVSKLNEAVPQAAIAVIGVDLSKDVGGGSFMFTSGVRH